MELVDCSRYRDALSARLDGEAIGLPPGQLHRHLARCAGCRDFEAKGATLNRAIRVAPANVPDLTGTIEERLAREPAPACRERAVRWCLALVALLQLSIALPALLGVVPSLSAHDARHVGAFALAVAAGFAYVAWRPRAAGGLLPVVAVLVGAVVVTAAVDVIHGIESAPVELADHAPELIGLVLVWLLARSRPPGVAVSR